MTSPNVIDINAVRLKKQSTVLLQIANIRTDGEVYRHIGISSELTFEQLHRVIAVCFGFTEEDTPWHFFEHHGARGHRINPQQQISGFLQSVGDFIDFCWGLWDFTIAVVEVYPRDKDTPSALCVGGSGSFAETFDITAINARLTGKATIAEVLSQVRPEVRDVVQRSKLFDFIPLLQAMDLKRETKALPLAAALPREVTMQAQEIFFSYVLALACLGSEKQTSSIVETCLEALGWANDDGTAVTTAQALALIPQSLQDLEELGACGPKAKSTVDRLDIYRALLRK